MDHLIEWDVTYYASLRDEEFTERIIADTFLAAAQIADAAAKSGLNEIVGIRLVVKEY